MYDLWTCVSHINLVFSVVDPSFPRASAFQKQKETQILQSLPVDQVNHSFLVYASVKCLLQFQQNLTGSSAFEVI